MARRQAVSQKAGLGKPRVPDTGNREKVSFKDTNNLRVTEPPKGAWAYKLGDSPDLRPLAELGPLPQSPEARANMWCQNCYTVHDPALCLGPLKKGLLDICVICGGRHLIEDCLWCTKENFLRYAWYCRQARPPVKTRVSLSDFRIDRLIPADRARMVAAVQRPGFSRAVDNDNMDYCVGSSIRFFWKSHRYGEEEAPEAEARKAMRRLEQGVDRYTILRIDPQASMAFGPAATMSARQGEQRPDIRAHTNKRIEYVKAEEAKLKVEEAKPKLKEEEAKPKQEEAKPKQEEAKPKQEEAKPKAEETKVKARQEAEPAASSSLEKRLLSLSFKELERFREGSSKTN